MATIVWHSVPPWAPSAFGGQTRLFVRSLQAAGHQVIVSADSGVLGTTTWEGVQVIGSPGDVHGSLVGWVSPLAAAGSIDLVVTLVDGFRLARQPLAGLPVVSWLPVHADPAEDAAVAHVRSSGAVAVAVSAFGQRALRNGGLRGVELIPHGIDRSTHRPLVPGDRAASRAEARRRLGIDPDRFVIGFVGTNVQPMVNRKGIPELMAAVGRLAARHEDLTLYLHTDASGRWMNGEPLDAMAHAFGADRAQIVVVPEGAIRNGLPDEEMAILYNAFDVLAAPSATEGFCLPMIEAQACGVPVVASNSSAQRENLGAGWPVGGQPRWYPDDRRWWFTPWVDDLVAAVEDARHPQHGAASRFDACLEFAARFDHDRLFDEAWRPLLERELARRGG